MITLQYQCLDGSEYVRHFPTLQAARQAVPSAAVDWVISHVVQKERSGWVEVLDAIAESAALE